MRLVLFIALTSLAVASADAPANAPNGWEEGMQPFGCTNDLYVGLFSPTCLKTIDGEGTLEPLRDPIDGIEYNAMGYNRQDNFIYAYSRTLIGGGNTIPAKELIRIDKDGDVERVRPGTPLPGDNEAHIGDVDADGNYWYSGGCWIRKVNIESGELQGEWNMDKCCGAADFAFAEDGMIYMIDSQGAGASNKFCQINPANPASPTYYMDTATTYPQYQGVGAFFFDGDNNAYLYKNDPGTVFKVDIANGDMLGSFDYVTLSHSDGCSCIDMEGPPVIGPPAAFQPGDERCTGYLGDESDPLPFPE